MTDHIKPRAVDLFAGAGGFSLAATRAGFEVVAAVENDRHAAETYRHNLCEQMGGDTELYENDIRLLDPNEFAQKHFSDATCDLLIGGPPCQGFSTHRILDAGVKDPRNELLHSYFSFLKALEPKVFLVENVPGMLWARHEKHVTEFYANAQSAGYHVFDALTLDARDYGVPQRRKRVFILGVADNLEQMKDMIWPPPPTHASEHKLEPNLEPWVDCSDVFKPAPADDPNDVHMRHTEDLIDVFKNTPANGGSRHESGRELPCHQNHDGHKDVYGRIDPAQPAPTMTTACINPSKGRFVHPVEHHGITVRQAARIQTFPDDFIFSGGLMAAGKQVGNAVPIRLAETLIAYVAAQLNDLPAARPTSLSKQPSTRTKSSEQPAVAA